MKGQLFLLGIVTAIALWIGTARWKARFEAGFQLSREVKSGGWELLVPSNGGGYQMWSPQRGLENVSAKKTSLPDVGDGGVDATPGFGWVAGASQNDYAYGYANAGDPSTIDLWHDGVKTAGVSVTGSTLFCPLLARDGSALYWLDVSPASTPAPLPGATPTPTYLSSPPTLAQGGSLHRVALRHALTGADLSAMATEIALPVAASLGDCPELADDGVTIAWLGTDLMTHVAKLERDHVVDEHRLPASDFELAPDGKWIATTTGGGVHRVDVATGTSTAVAPLTTVTRVDAISPDGTWILAEDASTTFSGRDFVALHVTDGAAVPLHVTTGYYGSYGQSRRMPWVATK